MNMLTFPGFTAEASVYRSSAHVGVVLLRLRQEGEVVPSMKCRWAGVGSYCCHDEANNIQGACCCNKIYGFCLCDWQYI